MFEDRSRRWRGCGVVVVFVVGMALGWGVAGLRAQRQRQALDAAGPEATRLRLEAEEMRQLDLTPAQRQVFQQAREAAHREVTRVLGRDRPEIEGILRRSDGHIRPVLSPRQLAVYDRMARERRGELPPRPIGADD